MTRHASLLSTLALLTLLVVTACDDDPVRLAGSPANGGAIRGRVVDTQGDPIDGAGILLCYDLPYGPKNGSKPTTSLHFTLPDPAAVRVWITEPCRGDLVRTLVDETIDGGVYEAVWDSRDDDGLLVTEGLYLAHLEADTLSRTMELFLGLVSYAGYESAAGMEVFATTDRDGRFAFGQDCLDFGAEITWTDDLGEPQDSFPVPNRVTVWALRDGYLAASSAAGVTVSPTTGAEVQIVMAPIAP